ncbi:DinB family protein [Tranquillimonas alkanivorans]|uniref:Uncharacterized damage-inducible protein DinB (Forms a four-helix bundle) n=1 Tax=Tranquillimonas alkanivorans TaxID=441119 RepID=A0A1I5RC15_9RHOB|nr:DinB family protein [Tranquillimonas alkanivorans]SFP55861.1 Uncharacterized damage-inducible protein DinB (forms a four-helix bundle) [Tranquillimonas alkanivorans]
MVTAGFCRLMAQYNAWQNASLYAAADELDPAEREADRGAHFASIRATLSHLLWADHVWMSRLAEWAKPPVGLDRSTDFVSDWPALVEGRRSADANIRDWAGGLTDQGLDGSLSWYSGALGRDAETPRVLCVVHMFNHQTHHRGQVHAMLTAAGATPEATDLFAMPEGAGWR